MVGVLGLVREGRVCRHEDTMVVHKSRPVLRLRHRSPPWPLHLVGKVPNCGRACARTKGKGQRVKGIIRAIQG